MDKSGLIDHVATIAEAQDDWLDIPQARIMTSVLIMLARPGIWPEKHVDLIRTVAGKFDRLAKSNSADTHSNVPLSMEEHRLRGLYLKAIESELEIIKRRAGTSLRKSILRKPPTWKQFWN